MEPVPQNNLIEPLKEGAIFEIVLVYPGGLELECGQCRAVRMGDKWLFDPEANARIIKRIAAQSRRWFGFTVVARQIYPPLPQTLLPKIYETDSNEEIL